MMRRQSGLGVLGSLWRTLAIVLVASVGHFQGLVLSAAGLLLRHDSTGGLLKRCI